ncbi:MAG: glycosyltransferase family 4 protein [Chitinophagaceae bacterium]|nr:glycosyltransferase family 4 protein [Chitinophagaceae bacterium]
MFDRYAIGGAQRIFLDALQSVADVEKQIYFTRYSGDDKLKDAFFSTPNAAVRDIHRYCENLFLRPFTIHYYAFYFNRHENLHLFSSNSTFFFDLLPFLKNSVCKTELFHNFAHTKNGMEWFGLATSKYMNYRVVYDNYTYNNIRKQYEQYGLSELEFKKVLFIEPGVTIPATLQKDYRPPLRVLYAGRGGPQKRVWLLNRVIEKLSEENIAVHFIFAGTMQDDLTEKTMEVSTMLGGISKEEEMYLLYDSVHVLILTSIFEGFPMVIKESMACGCVPVVTALEGNKMHLSTGVNALLIEHIADEEKVVNEAVRLIRELASDNELLKRLSQSAYDYARENFTRERFMEAYRVLLIERKAPTLQG